MTQRGTQHFFADDLDWKKSDGGTRYVQFSTQPGDPDRPLVVLSDMPPGFREPPHTHGCNYIEIILRGDMRVGKIDFGTGDVRVMQEGVGHGPLVAGDEGCMRMTIFDRAGGSMMRVLGKDAESPAG